MAPGVAPRPQSTARYGGPSRFQGFDSRPINSPSIDGRSAPRARGVCRSGLGLLGPEGDPGDVGPVVCAPGRGGGFATEDRAGLVLVDQQADLADLAVPERDVP